jgi:hypothetical protein
MGTREPDECMFCKCDLEYYHYEDFEENEERATKEGLYNDFNICKECLNKIRYLLGIIDKEEFDKIKIKGEKR